MNFTPNLFIPGFPKCGSFYLYELLAQHPDISMCSGKEPDYFTGRMEYEKYKSLFEINSSYKYYGEATVEYIVRPSSLSKIAMESPSSKFIIVMRNPVERAISHYYHRLKGGVDQRSLKDVLNNKGDENFPVFYSKYKQHLQTIYQLFPSNQILIIISEDLYLNPEQTLAKVFEFLNVGEIKLKLKKANQNTGTKVKNRRFNYYSRKLSHQAQLKKYLGFLTPILGRIRKYLENLNKKNINYTEDLLLKKYSKEFNILFKEDVLYVRGLLKDSTIWEE